MSKSYVAKFEGEIVGKRTSKDRTYTHAIVVIPSREYHRKAAYDYVADATDKSNFNYYLSIAEGRSKFTHSQDEVIKASIKVDGGFDAYVERIRQGKIANFEKQTFEPGVVAWAGRVDLAEKAARQYRGPRNEYVFVVPAEEVTKASRHDYNPLAVNEAIEASNRAGRKIDGQEARAIHALLKGRH